MTTKDQRDEATASWYLRAIGLPVGTIGRPGRTKVAWQVNDTGYAAEIAATGSQWRRERTRTPRRERYWIETEICYAEAGKRVCCWGMTENVSTSGLLMLCPQVLPLGTAVVMSFVLPGSQGKGSGARMSCNGHVVRVIAPADEAGRFGLAISIADYSLRPSRKGSELHPGRTE